MKISVLNGFMALLYIIILLSVGCLSAVYGQEQPSGFVLRGTLENATNDGTFYFKLGEAFVFFLPKDSALAPGVRALENKRVVITLTEDK